jgi:Protein of unknown function (DUF2441)
MSRHKRTKNSKILFMKYYYHLDRSGILHKGMTINLHKFSAGTEPEVAHDLNVLYPDGVSRFGAAILSGRSMNLTNLLREREKRLEEIRLSDYSECPSRFTTFFACRTVEQAQEFRTLVNSLESKIWKIEGRGGVVKDMNFLQGRPLLALEVDGHHYWRGHTSDNPFWECLVTLPIKAIETTDD